MKLLSCRLRIVLAVACYLFVVSYAQAQRDTLRVASADQKAQAVSSRMQRELSLNESQTQAVYNLCLERFAMIKAAGKSKTQQAQVTDEHCAKKLSLILTPDQFRVYQSLKEDVRRQRSLFQQKNARYALAGEDKDLDL